MPFDMVFDVFSDLTGGIITDMRSVIVAGISLILIIVGFDFIKHIMRVTNFNSSHSKEELGWLRDKRDSAEDPVDADYFGYLYNQRLAERANHDTDNNLSFK